MDIPESKEIRSTNEKSKHQSPWGVHRKAWQIPQLLFFFFASVQLKSCITWIWSQYTIRAKYRAEQNLLQYWNSTAPSAGAKQRKWTLATALCSHAQWGAQVLPLQAQSQTPPFCSKSQHLRNCWLSDLMLPRVLSPVAPGCTCSSNLESESIWEVTRVHADHFATCHPQM